MNIHHSSFILHNSPRSGFTLIEILVVSAIITVLASLGLLMSFDVYRGFSFHSEVSTVASLLMRARSRSLANINQIPHGLHFDSAGYNLFEGAIFDPDNPANEFIASGPGVEIVSSAEDIVFEQLSGGSSEEEIVIREKESERFLTININEEGRINW